MPWRRVFFGDGHDARGLADEQREQIMRRSALRRLAEVGRLSEGG